MQETEFSFPASYAAQFDFIARLTAYIEATRVRETAEERKYNSTLKLCSSYLPASQPANMASPVLLKVLASPPMSGQRPNDNSNMPCTSHSNGTR